jgi:hypothetical protein
MSVFAPMIFDVLLLDPWLATTFLGEYLVLQAYADIIAGYS